MNGTFEFGDVLSAGAFDLGDIVESVSAEYGIPVEGVLADFWDGFGCAGPTSSLTSCGLGSTILPTDQGREGGLRPRLERVARLAEQGTIGPLASLTGC